MKKQKLELKKKLQIGKDMIMQLQNGQMQGIAGGADTIFQCVSDGCGSLQDTRCAGEKQTVTGSPCPPQPPVSIFPCYTFDCPIVGTVPGPTRP